MLEQVSDLLGKYKYLAMFGILFLCGIGLPIPEEITLIASGLAVEWYDADFYIASIVCVSAILIGDSIIFFAGRHFGERFLRIRPMQWILRPTTLKKVDNLFSKHGNKAVFFARFFAGVRIGVYAYAGKHGMSWSKFLFLDLLGALISGPTSIAFGWWAAHKFASSREEAAEKATEIVEEFKVWIYIGLLILAGIFVLKFLLRRRANKQLVQESAQSESATASPQNDSADNEVKDKASTSDADGSTGGDSDGNTDGATDEPAEAAAKSD